MKLVIAFGERLNKASLIRYVELLEHSKFNRNYAMSKSYDYWRRRLLDYILDGRLYLLKHHKNVL